MRWIRRATEWARGRVCRGSEAGFTLVELMMALVVLTTALTAASAVLTSSFATVAFSRQRQTATALANQALEELRALPYSYLQLGLLGPTDSTFTADLSSATPPGQIQGASGNYTYNGEPLMANSGQTATPLKQHEVTSTQFGTTYKVYVYVTKYLSSTASNFPVRITVVASWTPAARAGLASSVSVQSVDYSPQGTDCITSSTHPFNAPCQSFFYASANTGTGDLSISGQNGAVPVPSIPALTGADLDTPSADSTMQAEQVQTIQTKAITGGTLAHFNNASDQTSGGQESASTSANSDPTQSDTAWQSNTATGSASANTVTNGTSQMTVTASSGDAGSSSSTTSAGGTNTCNNAASPQVGQTDGLPCGNATSTQGGTISSAITVPAGAATLTMSLLSVGAPSANSLVAYTKRTVNSSGTCTGDGCITATVKRSLGTIQIGALPSGFIVTSGTIPATSNTNWWNGCACLIKITGWSDSVTAQSGVGVTAASTTASGTITYWNGNSYSTVSAGGSLAGLASVTATGTVGGQVVTVTLSPSAISAGTTSTGPTSQPSTCPTTSPTSTCSATASSGSPIVGDILAQVTTTAGSVTLAATDTHVDFATLYAETSYGPAP